eukprot:988014_1
MSESSPNDDASNTHITEENKMLKDKLERANQQIKLLAAVLQIVHEDVCIKNEQLEILYTNLRHNPVWQDCMAVAHAESHSDNDNTNTNPNRVLSKLIKSKSKDDTSAPSPPMILITKPRDTARSVTRSRSLSPRHRRPTITSNAPSNESNQSNPPHHLRNHKLLISSDIIRTINEDTKCYLNCMSEDTQIALCRFIPYDDLIYLAQSNKLWYSIIRDDLVWRICFRVKWPLDELTYSSDSSTDSNEMSKTPTDNTDGTEIAFSRFHKSLHKRKHRKEKRKRNKYKKKQIAIQQRRSIVSMDEVLSASPELSSSPPCVSTANGIRDTSKTWKQQFKDRIHIEKNWRQGKAKVMTLIGHNGSVTDLKFDEYRLITSSDDGSIILWHLDTMKKWKPKHYERNRKQLEKGNEAQKNYKYTFFPSKKEQDNDMDPEVPEEYEHKHHDDPHTKEDKHPSFPRTPIRTSTDDNEDSDSSSLIQLQLNNLYHLNDNWNMNDTKLSAWRHSFVTSFGSAIRDRLPMLSTTKKKKATKTWGSQLDTSSMLLQNHHYSRDLNFKRFSFQGHGGPIWALDFDNELLVSGSYDKCIKIWNISSGNCRATLRGHEEWVSGIKLRHKYIVSCSWDASIRLWKLDDTRYSGKCITKLQSQPGNAIYCVQWSTDRNFIVSGCRHQAVQIWDLQKEKMIKTFMGHLKQVYCIQVSNSLILSGSADRTIKMWDPRTAGCLASFNDHMGPVMKLQFDDHKLISAGYDKQVRIFDLRARKQLHSLSGHSKVIFSLQYDHKKIITGSADKRVLVWNFNG